MNFDPYATLSQNEIESLHLQNKEVESLVRQVLNNEPGLKLLGYLEAITILRPSVLIGQDPNLGYFREGQNDIVRQLISILEQGSSTGSLRKSFFSQRKSKLA